MSVFNPMSISGQPNQKMALLDRLMQQYQEASGRAAGLAQSVGGSIGATPFHVSHPFGGMGLRVGPPHALPPGLAARLGPGAINASGGVARGFQPGPVSPHAGGNPAAPAGAAHAIPSAPAQAVAAAAPTAPNAPASPPGTFAGTATGTGYVDPVSAAASAGRLNQLHPEVVQRLMGVYASPYHAHVGL